MCEGGGQVTRGKQPSAILAQAVEIGETTYVKVFEPPWHLETVSCKSYRRSVVPKVGGRSTAEGDWTRQEAVHV